MTKFEAWDNSYYIVVSKDYEHTHQVQEDEDWYMVTPHWVKLRKVTESDGDKTLIRYINDHTGCVVRSEEWRRKL